MGGGIAGLMPKPYGESVRVEKVKISHWIGAELGASTQKGPRILLVGQLANDVTLYGDSKETRLGHRMVLNLVLFLSAGILCICVRLGYFLCITLL